MNTDNKPFEWNENLAIEFAVWYRKQQLISSVENFGTDVIEEFKNHKFKPKKDYEILKIKHKGMCDVIDYKDRMIGIEQSDIISVNRLSDNEIFTIGDYCIHGYIQKLHIVGNTVGAIFEHGGAWYPVKLADLKKEGKLKMHPIGLIPEWLYKEQRLQEIKEAIVRYYQEGVGIPVEWVIEKNELSFWLSQRKIK